MNVLIVSISRLGFEYCARFTPRPAQHKITNFLNWENK